MISIITVSDMKVERTREKCIHMIMKQHNFKGYQVITASVWECGESETY